MLIATPGTDAPLRPLVINLRDAAVEGAFERVWKWCPDESPVTAARAMDQYKRAG